MLQKWQSIDLWKRVLIGLFIGLLVGVILYYGIGNPRFAKKQYTGNYGTLSVEDFAWEYKLKESIESEIENLQIPLTEKFELELDYQSKKSLNFDVRLSEDSYWLDFIEPDQHSFKSKNRSSSVKRSFRMKDFRITTASDLADDWIYPFGDAFVRLIKMLVIPLIATTLVAGITAMGDPKKLGSLGVRTLAMYILTTFFAVSLGLILGTVIQPGAGIAYSDASAKAQSAVSEKIEASSNFTIVEQLLEIIPTNPIQALSEGKVLPTIFFAIMIGVGILLAGKPGDILRQFFDSAAEVVMRVTMIVMELAPLGVMALMAWVLATKGFGVIANMGKLALALYLCCFLQIVLVYWGLIVKGLLRLPIAPFIRGVADAQSVAFSTSSSSATLPATISCAEKNLGIDKSVAGSVLPLGATINMDGTAIYLGLIALFASQAIGLEMSMEDYLNVALTATLVSIGAAGIPSAGLLLAATVLGVINVSEQDSLLVIAFIFPFDRLLDMMRTVTNVTGDLAVASTVAKWDGMLDETIYKEVDIA